MIASKATQHQVKGSALIANYYIRRDVPKFGAFLAEKYQTTGRLIQPLALLRLEREGLEPTQGNLDRAFLLCQSALAGFLKGDYARRSSGALKLSQTAEDVLAVSRPEDAQSVVKNLLDAYDRRKPETFHQRRRAERMEREDAKLRAGAFGPEFRASSLDRCVLALWAPEIVEELKIKSTNVRSLEKRFENYVLRPTYHGDVLSNDEARNEAVISARLGRDRDLQDFLGGRYADVRSGILELTSAAQNILNAFDLKRPDEAQLKLLQSYALHNDIVLDTRAVFRVSRSAKFIRAQYEHTGPKTRLIKDSTLFSEVPEIGIPLAQRYSTFSNLAAALVDARIGRHETSTNEFQRLTRETVADVYFTLDGAYAEQSDEGDGLTYTTNRILEATGVEPTSTLTWKLLLLNGRRTSGDDYVPPSGDNEFVYPALEARGVALNQNGAGSRAAERERSRLQLHGHFTSVSVPILDVPVANQMQAVIAEVVDETAIEAIHVGSDGKALLETLAQGKREVTGAEAESSQPSLFSQSPQTAEAGLRTSGDDYVPPSGDNEFAFPGLEARGVALKNNGAGSRAAARERSRLQLRSHFTSISVPVLDVPVSNQPQAVIAEVMNETSIEAIHDGSNGKALLERLAQGKQEVTAPEAQVSQPSLLSQSPETAEVGPSRNADLFVPRRVVIESDEDRYIPRLDEGYFIQRLNQMRRDAVSAMAIHQDGFTALPSIESDDRPAEEADLEAARRAIARYQGILSGVDKALKRIEQGTYGECKDTGEEIPLTRLVANPLALRTIEAEEARELKNRAAQPNDRRRTSENGLF